MPTGKNIAVIAPKDFDGDGDMDVFLGARSIVGIYGVSPDHVFLENQGDGTFKDVSRIVAAQVKANSGMITDAKWVDIDGDRVDELVTVSDWDAPVIYKNNGTTLTPMESNLGQIQGCLLYTSPSPRDS